MPIAPGVYPDLSNEDYHADEAISNSDLKSFVDFPARFEWERENPGTKVPTDALKDGNIAHTCILEPQCFDERYLIAPDQYYDEKKNEKIPFDNKRGNKWAKEFVVEAELQGKEPRLRNECDTYFAMRDMVQAHPIANEILKHAKFEQSFFAKDEEHGVMIKSRPDIWCDDVIIDYKTTALDIVNEETWALEMAKYKYYIQGIFHSKALTLATGNNIVGVAYIVQQKKAPYFVWFLPPAAEWSQVGERFYQGVMPEIAQTLQGKKHPIPEAINVPLSYRAATMIETQERYFNTLMGREVFQQSIGA